MKKAISFILCLCIILNVLLFTACSDVEKTYESVYNLSALDELAEKGVIEKINKTDAKKEISEEVFIDFLERYTGLNGLSALYDNTVNCDDEINGISIYDAEQFMTYLFCLENTFEKSQTTNNLLNYVELERIVKSVGMRYIEKDCDGSYMSTNESIVVNSSVNSISNISTVGDLIVFKQQGGKIQFENVVVKGKVKIIGGLDCTADFIYSTINTIETNTLGQGNVDLKVKDSQVELITSKSNTEIKNESSKIQLVQSDKTGNRIKLNGEFKEIDLNQSTWLKVASSEVEKLVVLGENSDIAVDKNGKIKDLVVKNSVKVVNKGEILTAEIYSKGVYFSKNPLNLIGNEEEVNRLKSVSETTQYNELDFSYIKQIYDIPKIEIVILENDDKGIEKATSYKDEVEIIIDSVSDIEILSVTLSSKGRILFEESSKNEKYLKLSSLPCVSGKNTLSVAVTNESGETARKTIEINKEVEETFLQAPVLSFIISEETMKLDWNEIEGQNNSYTIYRKTDGKVWEILSNNIIETEFIDNTMEDGQSYSYAVAVTNGQSFSANSNTVEYVTRPCTPNVRYTINGETVRIDFSNTIGAKWYTVEKNIGEGYTSYIDKYLGESITEVFSEGAKYRVKAINEKGESEFSQEVVLKRDIDKLAFFNPNGDSDKDGLTDSEELMLGLDWNNADSDKDGLNDGDELRFETNPLVKDSDGDGVEDGAEIINGTDPTNVENGKEFAVYKNVASETEYAKVSVKGGANFAKAKIIANENEPNIIENIEGIVGKVVTFSANEETFESAEIEFTFDAEELRVKGILAEELKVYYIDSQNQKLVPLNTEVDVKKGVAIVNTEHFSSYVLGSERVNVDLSGVEVIFAVERQYSYTYYYDDYYYTYSCGGHATYTCNGRHIGQRIVSSTCPGHDKMVTEWYCDGHGKYCPGHQKWALFKGYYTEYCSGCLGYPCPNNGRCKYRRIFGFVHCDGCVHTYESYYYYCDTGCVVNGYTNCGKTTTCSNYERTRHDYTDYSTETKTFPTNSAEKKLFDKFMSEQMNNQLKIGAVDNANLSQLATKDATALSSISTKLGQTYSSSVGNISFSTINGKYSDDVKNKVVNYVYLYGNISTLSNNVKSAYTNYGIHTNIISLYSGTDSNKESLKAVAQLGKGSYIGVDYSTISELDGKISNTYDKLSKH